MISGKENRVSKKQRVSRRRSRQSSIDKIMDYLKGNVELDSISSSSSSPSHHHQLEDVLDVIINQDLSNFVSDMNPEENMSHQLEDVQQPNLFSDMTELVEQDFNELDIYLQSPSTLEEEDVQQQQQTKFEIDLTELVELDPNELDIYLQQLSPSSSTSDKSTMTNFYPIREHNEGYMLRKKFHCKKMDKKKKKE